MLSTSIPDFAREFTMPPLEWHRRIREWLRFMRDTEPVSYDEETKCWRIYRYDDVSHVMRDYAVFSSEDQAPGKRDSLVHMDPPHHRQLREVIASIFSARTIAQMAPQIAEITRDLLAIPLERGEMDFVSEVAIPLPVKVVATMLGVPVDDWQIFHDWSSAILADFTAVASPVTLQSMHKRLMQAVSDMHTYFDHLLEERRRNPGRDFISLLLEASVEGQSLSVSELFSFYQTLLLSGLTNTSQLLGNALLCFDEYPEAWQQLLQNRSLVPSAIEEILRYMTPNKSFAEDVATLKGRTATVDVMIGNQLIHKGDNVRWSTISANFDERQWRDPERFDIQRTPNRHLSFGHGIHFCLGASLARLQARVVLETLLEVMPRWSIRRDVPLELFPSSQVFGAKQLPIQILPAR